MNSDKPGIGRRIWRLYADGFREMTIGRYLWAIILIKLAVLFLVSVSSFSPTFSPETMTMTKREPRLCGQTYLRINFDHLLKN